MTEEQEDRLDAVYMKRVKAEKNQKFIPLREVLRSLDCVATEGCKATTETIKK